MKPYNPPPPQASPTDYDRYGHRPSTRYEMDHRRHPLMDISANTTDQIGSNNQSAPGGDLGDSSTSQSAKAGSSGVGGVVRTIDDHDMNGGGRRFDNGRTSAGYHVLPAVAISRRGGTKRSPYEQSEHIFSSDRPCHSYPSMQFI